ncbi:phage tail fiber protein [Nitratidesulfovibrio sp. 1201_IL3209]|uniref:phage tail fiber protein n=1 Tax=Nitratidesulfovibrio sp. 1201_IL3209 TaxID=3084053 RepID=UPI002FDB77C0
MGATTTAKNAMLDAITVTKMSLHSGDPGAAGTSNEISGGSPAYARKDVTLGAAATAVPTPQEVAASESA